MYDTCKTGRTRQAAGAGKHPPEAVARHIWAERRVYAAAAVVVTVFCTRLRKNNKQQEQTKEDEET